MAEFNALSTVREIVEAWLIGWLREGEAIEALRGMGLPETDIANLITA